MQAPIWPDPMDLADLRAKLAAPHDTGAGYHARDCGACALAYEAAYLAAPHLLAEIDRLRRIVEAAEALTYAMACERPLREPETHPDVLAAWDVLERVLA
jgi:hypothetical protein